MLIAFIIGFGCLMLFCAGCFYVAGCDSDLVDEALNKHPYGDIPRLPSIHHDRENY